MLDFIVDRFIPVIIGAVVGFLIGIGVMLLGGNADASWPLIVCPLICVVITIVFGEKSYKWLWDMVNFFG